RHVEGEAHLALGLRLRDSAAGSDEDESEGEDRDQRARDARSTVHGALPYPISASTSGRMPAAAKWAMSLPARSDSVYVPRETRRNHPYTSRCRIFGALGTSAVARSARRLVGPSRWSSSAQRSAS